MTDIHEIGDYLLGTCYSIAHALEHFDLPWDEDDLLDRLLDINVETCRLCGWWFESGELTGLEEDDEPGYCADCRVST